MILGSYLLMSLLDGGGVGAGWCGELHSLGLAFICAGGVRWLGGFWRGRCGGCSPAQGRAEGPNCSGSWLVVGLFVGYLLCYTGFSREENMFSPLFFFAQAGIRSSGSSERHPNRRI